MLKVLYLRTLYALNLKAGGSVGHTAGVINAMSNCVDLAVYSNDELVDVKCNINVIRPFVRKYLPQNIKELFLNVQFISGIQLYPLWGRIWQRNMVFHLFWSLILLKFGK